MKDWLQKLVPQGFRGTGTNIPESSSTT
ncbi:hypothetical protein CEXT_63381, partial [Caerostris extrusa]